MKPQKSKKLILPEFKNEDEERKFWDKFDLSDYATADDLEDVAFPNLQPTTRSISLRVPEYMIMELKEKANKIYIPYQALIKKYIADGIKRDSSTPVHTKQ